MIFFASLILGTVVLTLTLWAQRYCVQLRRARLTHLELVPNCLLTRYPIAFIGGRKSLFRLFDHWNDIPQYLREHGYSVLVVDPAKKTSKKNSEAQSILQALKSLNGPAHVVCDSSQCDIIHAIAEEKIPQCMSLTLVQNPNAHREFKESKDDRSAARLRATAQAIEIYPLPAFSVRELGTWPNRLSQALLTLHNLRYSKDKTIDPLETGEWIDQKGWRFEAPFLNLAISLAERDARWSD